MEAADCEIIGGDPMTFWVKTDTEIDIDLYMHKYVKTYLHKQITRRHVAVNSYIAPVDYQLL